MSKALGLTLGQRITQARLDAGSERGKGVTQTELGRAVGVTPGTVSQWEADNAVPSLETLTAIAAALRVAPGPLTFGDAANKVAEQKPKTHFRRVKPAGTSRGPVTKKKASGGGGSS